MDGVTVKADSKELTDFLEGLLADLSNAPHEFRKLALDFFNLSPELVSFESSLTSGAVVTVLLKPSQRLLDLGLAIRTGDFDLAIVKHSHGDDPYVDVRAWS